jgi:Uri superfamily endonuclease
LRYLYPSISSYLINGHRYAVGLGVNAGSAWNYAAERVMRHFKASRKPRSRRWTNERAIVRKPAIRCRTEFATAEVLCLPRRQQFIFEARILNKYP